MFAKHLPPSAGAARVLALDESAAAELPAGVDVIGLSRLIFSPRAVPLADGACDAVVGYAGAGQVEAWARLLRPGGRLILARRAEPDDSAALLEALTAAGLTHCLVEAAGGFTLYRGERPPEGSSVERLQTLAAQARSRRPAIPFVFLLVIQTPNKPAWKMAPGEKFAWRAVTVRDPDTDRPVLLAFSSLVKAVAFMQTAVLAQFIAGVNKVGKFPAEVAWAWDQPLWLNPEFDEVAGWALGAGFDVDPETAITGEE